MNLTWIGYVKVCTHCHITLCTLWTNQLPVVCCSTHGMQLAYVHILNPEMRVEQRGVSLSFICSTTSYFSISSGEYRLRSFRLFFYPSIYLSNYTAFSFARWRCVVCHLLSISLYPCLKFVDIV